MDFNLKLSFFRICLQYWRMRSSNPVLCSILVVLLLVAIGSPKSAKANPGLAVAAAVGCANPFGVVCAASFGSAIVIVAVWREIAVSDNDNYVEIGEPVVPPQVLEFFSKR